MRQKTTTTWKASRVALTTSSRALSLLLFRFLVKVYHLGLLRFLHFMRETFSQRLPGNGWFCLLLLLLFSC